jgi:hypothetical protein
VSRREQAYATTAVAVAKTQEDIRKLLVKHGARGMQLTEIFEPPSLNLRFQALIGPDDGPAVLAMVSMEIPTGEEQARNEREKEQLRRQAARALFYYLKSQLEAVDFGLVKFEEAFLAHFEITNRTGELTTVGAAVLPEFLAASAQSVPMLLPGKAAR